MKIISLKATDLLRLRAVEIHPDGHVQIVSGRNGQGKSSVLNAIWLAIGGGQASRAIAKPIRDGESYASVRLDLGDIVVTRTWAGDPDDDATTSMLTVKNADGTRARSPQALLDSLVGRLSFDPLEFTRLAPRAQRDALLDVIGLGDQLAVLDQDRQRVYDQRQDTGREGRRAAAVVEERGDVEDTQGVTEPVPVYQLTQDLMAAQQLVQSRETATRDLQRAKAETAAARHRLRELEDAEAEALEAYEDLPAAPRPQDLEELRSRIDGAEEINARLQRNQEREQARQRAEELRAKYAQMTAQITEIDGAKADLLAGVEFPVAGLGFDEQGVTYNSVPFSQASSAEQIRVSLGMAMALNPTLRVIRIMDGSLLDDESMAAIREQAEAGDYQVWIERVSDDAGVVIEDGQVAS